MRGHPVEIYRKFESLIFWNQKLLKGYVEKDWLTLQESTHERVHTWFYLSLQQVTKLKFTSMKSEGAFYSRNEQCWIQESGSCLKQAWGPQMGSSLVDSPGKDTWSWNRGKKWGTWVIASFSSFMEPTAVLEWRVVDLSSMGHIALPHTSVPSSQGLHWQTHLPNMCLSLGGKQGTETVQSFCPTYDYTE